MNWIILYLKNLWFFTLEISPYLLQGFLFAGILNLLLKKEHLLSYLGKGGFRSVCYAALMGIPLPLCSCGVIPTGVSFHHNGASKGASVSFLISTPQTGVDSILVTYSLLGLPMAILRPIIALITGLFGGWLTDLITKEEQQWRDQKREVDHSEGILDALKYAFVTFLGDIAFWLVIGILLAALITTVIPQNFFVGYIDTPLLGMFFVLLGAIPLYVCATASVPIAAALMMSGLSPGAAIVFLMAGPATNIATITVLGKSLGKKTLLTYLFSIISGAMLFGIIVDYCLPHSWFLMTPISEMDQAHHGNWIEIVSALILIGLIMRHFITKFLSVHQKEPCCCHDHCNHENLIGKMEENQMDEVIIKIEGMNCNHCKMSVETNLKKLEGIESVLVDLNHHEALLKGEKVNLKEVEETVNALGFHYQGYLNTEEK